MSKLHNEVLHLLDPGDGESEPTVVDLGQAGRHQRQDREEGAGGRQLRVSMQRVQRDQVRCSVD